MERYGMGISEDIDNEIKLEGGLSNDPQDPGGLTYEGISKKSNPELFKNGLPTDAQVRAVYLAKYVQGPGFDKITDKQLQAQLIDFGVNSGTYIAITYLQKVLGVAQDGILGPTTLAALSKAHSDDINTALAIERIKMIGRLVEKNPSQLKFLNGWLSRCCEFLV